MLREEKESAFWVGMCLVICERVGYWLACLLGV